MSSRLYPCLMNRQPLLTLPARKVYFQDPVHSNRCHIKIGKEHHGLHRVSLYDHEGKRLRDRLGLDMIS